MLALYKILTTLSSPFLGALLSSRLKKGKEDSARVEERKGITQKQRPEGPLAWVHAASVGEAQSALILINTLLEQNKELHILVTTGTVTSSEIMAQKLPERAFHQFYPLDHPSWVKKFLDHWTPDLALWMESELWPNMLLEVQKRNIPAVLTNARLSDASFKTWSRFKGSAKKLLNSFSLILTQTAKDEERFKSLCDQKTLTTGNLKFSAAPLAVANDDLKTVQKKISKRPLWVFASTHKGEEEMACRIHDVLKNNLPDVLTVIVPRHPERRDDILENCKTYDLEMTFRGTNKNLPEKKTDIYVADTLGELGLFYTVAPIACIGRSFSDDGGGGHNPIEAAQLGAAVLYGPNVQYQQEIYDEMDGAKAALRMPDEHRMADTLHKLMTDEDRLKNQQDVGLEYAQNKVAVIDRVMEALDPILKQANIL